MVQISLRSKCIRLDRQWYILMRKLSKLYQEERMHHFHRLCNQMGILMELELNLEGMNHFHCCGIRYHKLLELLKKRSFHIRLFFVQMGSLQLLED